MLDIMLFSYIPSTSSPYILIRTYMQLHCSVMMMMMMMFYIIILMSSYNNHDALP